MYARVLEGRKNDRCILVRGKNFFAVDYSRDFFCSRVVLYFGRHYFTAIRLALILLRLITRLWYIGGGGSVWGEETKRLEVSSRDKQYLLSTTVLDFHYLTLL